MRKIKRIMSSDPVLKWPDYSQPFILEVDASQYALGAVLYQKDDRGRPQAVGHHSKALIPAEHNYDVYDWELLALIKGLEHWRHLLMGAEHETMVYTNHKNVMYYQDPC